MSAKSSSVEKLVESLDKYFGGFAAQKQQTTLYQMDRLILPTGTLLAFPVQLLLANATANVAF